MKKVINKIEDIYPLTIISMRLGKFAIINVDHDSECVIKLDCNDEYQYLTHKCMERDFEYVIYGIGNTIGEAFIDFKKRYSEIEEI